MIYAPIIIPTLNRYEHLENCINTLKTNTWAKYTELFISVDYPPSNRYFDGYFKVKEYLSNNVEGFKNVKIIYQKTNLGPFNNAIFLKNLVFKKYDRYICTEDDNIFSSKFIEYMDINLDKYKDDYEVLAINGYCMPIDWKDDKGIIKQNCVFSAWGYGMWKDRYEKICGFNTDELKLFLNSFDNARYLCKFNQHYFVDSMEIARGKHYIALDSNGNLRFVDLVIALYMSLHKFYVISPLTSLVRNNGHDGSGVNCDNKNKYDFDTQIITDDIDYNKLYISDKTYNLLVNKYFNTNKLAIFKAWVKWVFVK